MSVLASFSLNPWYMFLEIVGTYHLIRRIFFAFLVIVFWGNWNMLGMILVVWALYEVLALVKQRYWN